MEAGSCRSDSLRAATPSVRCATPARSRFADWGRRRRDGQRPRSRAEQARHIPGWDRRQDHHRHDIRTGTRARERVPVIQEALDHGIPPASAAMSRSALRERCSLRCGRVSRPGEWLARAEVSRRCKRAGADQSSRRARVHNPARRSGWARRSNRLANSWAYADIIAIGAEASITCL